MKRGDLVTISIGGEQGKPRPALVVQADAFAELPAVTVLPVTGTLLDTPLLRIQVEPSERNGLAKPSQIMVDKPQTVPLGKVGGTFGTLEAETLLSVNRALALFLGLG